MFSQIILKNTWKLLIVFFYVVNISVHISVTNTTAIGNSNAAFSSGRKYHKYNLSSRKFHSVYLPTRITIWKLVAFNSMTIILTLRP